MQVITVAQLAEMLEKTGEELQVMAAETIRRQANEILQVRKAMFKALETRSVMDNIDDGRC